MRKLKLIVLAALLLGGYKTVSASVLNAPASFNFVAFAGTDTTSLEAKNFNIYVLQGVLNINYNKPQELKNGEVVVYNLLGQEVTRKKLEITSNNQVSISGQNTCYLVRISYSGKVYTQKVIVRSSL